MLKRLWMVTLAIRKFFGGARPVLQKSLNLEDFHEEWRLIVFVFLFGGVSALCLISPQLVLYVGGGSISVGLYLMRRYGAASYPLLLAAGAFLAVILTTVRLSGFETYEFRADQYVSVTGRVDLLEFRPEKPARLTIEASELTGFRGAKQPERLRLSVRTTIDPRIDVGSQVTLKAIISPVGGALEPGGYDFGRAALYQGIDARGYAASPIKLVGVELKPKMDAKAWVNRIRFHLAGEIREAIPGQPGALAVALTLGMRQGISDATSETLRRAGLSHLLAISGLHMGIVAGVMFFAFELLFAAIPAIALRIMPRKLAVVPAWTMAAIYLLLSGGSVATVRAFIMVSVAILALLAGRRVLSLRSVALAAMVVLLIWPESVLTVGFQMSFAATAGLIAFYERVSFAHFFRREGQSSRFWRRALAGIFMIGVTSLVAQASVAPFAFYHFQAISLVAIVANMLVLPIVSFLLMPVLLVTLFLAMIEAVSLTGPLVYTILEIILKIAGFTASPSFSTLRVEPMADITLMLLIAAFLALLLFVSKKGAYVAALLITVAILMPGREMADVLISKTGSVIAVRQNMDIWVSGGRKQSFRLRSWRRYWGHDPFGASLRFKGVGRGAASRFEVAPGYFITRVRYLSAVHESCAAGGIIILPRKYTRYCKGAALVIENEMLQQFGPAGLIIKKANNPDPEYPAGIAVVADQPVLRWSNPPES